MKKVIWQSGNLLCGISAENHMVSGEIYMLISACYQGSYSELVAKSIYFPEKINCFHCSPSKASRKIRQWLLSTLRVEGAEHYAGQVFYS